MITNTVINDIIRVSNLSKRKKNVGKLEGHLYQEVNIYAHSVPYKHRYILYTGTRTFFLLYHLNTKYDICTGPTPVGNTR